MMMIWICIKEFDLCSI